MHDRSISEPPPRSRPLRQRSAGRTCGRTGARALLLRLLLGALLHAGSAAAEECVVGGLCLAGVCVGGTPTSCPEDPDPCVLTTCDPVRGCLRSPLTGRSCDDGDACTSADRCVAGSCAGQPLRCAPDAFECTEDRCVEGTCRHQAVDARCSAEECNAPACRPGDRHADARGCVAVPVDDGSWCGDDGLACTDEVCEAGTCLHVPIDARCGPPGECSGAVCAPERDERDAAGCVAGILPQTDRLCAEDGDPCSDDLCRSGRCGHEPVEDVTTCAPIRRAFRKAGGLAALARTLAAGLEDAGAPRGHRVLAEELTRIAENLEAAADVLAGRAAATEEPAAGDALAGTEAQRRARAAAGALQRAPRQLRALVTTLGRSSREPASRTLRPRVVALVRGVRALRAELVRVQAIHGTFVRSRRLG